MNGPWMSLQASFQPELTRGRAPVEIFGMVRLLLNDEILWTRQALARDVHGRPVRPNHPDAVCWCVEGAIAFVANDRGVVPPFFMQYMDLVIQYDFMDVIHETFIWREPVNIGNLEDEDDVSFMRLPELVTTPIFQDRVTHATVLALLDACLRRLR